MKEREIGRKRKRERVSGNAGDLHKKWEKVVQKVVLLRWGVLQQNDQIGFVRK